MRALWISAALAFLLDQASKVAVVHLMDLRHSLVMPVLPPYLVFRMGWNEGVNFGLFSGANARWGLIVLALVICGVLIHWARGFQRQIALIAAGLVVGGALANAFDRVIYGAVADFLNMSCCGIQNPYAFNLADVFIFAGAFGLVIWADGDKQKTP